MRKKQKQNKWRELRALINNLPVGSYIVRRHLMSTFRENSSQPNTIDNYRNYATQAGYLKKAFPGCYIIVSHIPETLSKRDLIKQAYPTS